MKNLLSTTALLLVLSFSGAAYAHDSDMSKNDAPSYMDKAISKLPKDDAAQFRDTMKQAHEKNMALADQIHSLHDDIDAIVTAEPFDEAAFLDKSAKLREVYETMRTNTDEAFATAIGNLSQDERKIIATSVSYPHPKHQAMNTAQ